MPAYDTTFWPDVRGQEYDRTSVHQTIRSPWETAGDQVDGVTGANLLYAYALGHRTLTDAQAAAFFHAVQVCGGDTDGMYFLEWVLRAETNLIIGTGTGSGDITFDLKCRLKNDSDSAAGLAITKDFVSVAYSAIVTDTGNNYVQHKVTIAAANNTLNAVYRATWTEARRRRLCRLDGPAESSFVLTERRGGSNRWTLGMALIETEAS